jgi:superfamily II DNA or RNA helicase
MQECKTLDDYLAKHGGLLGRQAQETLEPLHVPGRDPLPDFSRFKRQPFPAQQHVIAGLVSAMRTQKSAAFCGEMGTGKTIAAMVAVHLSAQHHWNERGAWHYGETIPYRALVFCPGQLVRKWEREILETVPGAKVTVIENCHQLNDLRRRRCHVASGANWYIIARDRAKLGAKWGPAAAKRKLSVKQKAEDGTALPAKVFNSLCCPKCGKRLENKDGIGMDMDDLGKRQQTCPGDLLNGIQCGEQLWSYYGPQRGGFDRFEPAKYIHKRMRGYFDYLVLDEAHEEKAADSCQANAAGSLIAAAKKVIALTGTLIGGYAEHIRPLLFRMAPKSLIAEGLTWSMATEFNRRYGRIEKTIRTRDGVSDDGDCKMGRGKRSSRNVTEKVVPGIVPTLFGRHLLGNSVYLSLDEVSDRLPALREFILPVPMEAEQAIEYQRIEKDLKDANKDLVLKGNMALLGAMLQCLLAYPDLPFGWDWVGYWIRSNIKFGEKLFQKVVLPAELKDQVYPKEAKLIEVVQAEKAAGRQCWVFVQYTDTRPVLDRMVRLLEEAGLKVGVLRSSVSPAKREEWIREKGPGFDVVVSHPKLVETGLDLFDKRPGGCNFCTLIFYETGYNLFTLRQASRRAWRIGQRRECRVYYLYYEGTMQAAAMALMGRKMQAAQALEGKFSTEGLVALGGDDDGMSIEMALAQSLDSLLPGDAARTWGMVGAEGDLPATEAPPLQTVAEDEEEEDATVASELEPVEEDPARPPMRLEVKSWLDEIDFDSLVVEEELDELDDFLAEEEDGDGPDVADPEVAEMLADFFDDAA